MNPNDPSHLPPEAAAALRAGKKIEAIKIVRERLGIGLKEAKELVERVGDAGPIGSRDAISTSSESAPHPTSLPPEAYEALRAGNKIEAIKIVRDRHALGLKEAKDLVERIETTDPILARNAQQRGEARRPSCLTFLVTVALVVAAAWYFLLA